MFYILRLPIYSEQEYANLAINLANDQEKYTKIRKQLIDHNLNHKESPYWNLEQYVKHLEVGFQAIWERYISGEAPAHVNITHIMNRNKDGSGISLDKPDVISGNVKNVEDKQETDKLNKKRKEDTKNKVPKNKKKSKPTGTKKSRRSKFENVDSTSEEL